MVEEQGRVAPGGQRISWGIGDFVVTFLGGLFLSMVVAFTVLAILGWEPTSLSDNEQTIVNSVSGTAQFLGFWLLLVLILRRKGGGLLKDLAIFADSEVGPIFGCFIGGIALQFGLGILVLPLTAIGEHETQAVVEQLENASGISLAVLAIMAGLLAPIFEELLFRGVLLRSLMRRTGAFGAVLISAVVFGVVHLVDPSTFAEQPALIGLATVSGIVAVYGGGMLRSIALHMGFNFVTLLLILV